MKIKVSISMDKETMELVDNRVSSGDFRNRSHMIEHSVLKSIKGEQK
jgi:Arc/MetJ-type ribon-helix-helix transcriptional regulator